MAVVNSYQNARCHICKDRKLSSHRRENLVSRWRKLVNGRLGTTQPNTQTCKFWGFHRIAAQDHVLLGYDAVSLGNQFLTFRKHYAPLKRVEPFTWWCGVIPEERRSRAHVCLNLWRVATNILNKQSRTADKGWSSSLGVGQGANNSSP
jgi:hypothetical protein